MDLVLLIRAFLEAAMRVRLVVARFLQKTIGGFLEDCDELSPLGTDCASTLGSGEACLVVERVC